MPLVRVSPGKENPRRTGPRSARRFTRRWWRRSTCRPTIVSRHSPSTPRAGSSTTRNIWASSALDGVVFIQITLNTGGTLDQKQALYRALAEKLARDPGLRKKDLLVSLVEVPKENWSFGNERCRTSSDGTDTAAGRKDKTADPARSLVRKAGPLPRTWPGPRSCSSSLLTSFLGREPQVRAVAESGLEETNNSWNSRAEPAESIFSTKPFRCSRWLNRASH